ncbi:MAG: amidohydrolase family protein, partial [Gammaproteobacteria bacterium]
LNFEQTFMLDSQSTYEPGREESFAAIASEQNIAPEALLYDHLMGAPDRLAIMFFTNYTDYSLDAVRQMQLDDVTVTGLSDAGAHVSLIFDAVNPTYQLSFWTRDRRRGETLPLSYVIHRATRKNAQLFGFDDRGLIAPGMKADVNVIDYDNLRLGELAIRQDLPAGGVRLMQGASGYIATLIDGVRTRDHDQDTGARPGRLIRA